MIKLSVLISICLAWLYVFAQLDIKSAERERDKAYQERNDCWATLHSDIGVEVDVK